MKQTRQMVHAIKQSIYLDVYGYMSMDAKSFVLLQQLTVAKSLY
jgi:hypothetical protein